MRRMGACSLSVILWVLRLIGAVAEILGRVLQMRRRSSSEVTMCEQCRQWRRIADQQAQLLIAQQEFLEAVRAGGDVWSPVPSATPTVEGGKGIEGTGSAPGSLSSSLSDGGGI